MVKLNNTMFAPSGTHACALHDYYVVLDDGQAPYKTKSAMIMAAFVTGKQIQFSLADGSTDAASFTISNGSENLYCAFTRPRITGVYIKP
jgi:hypothetical protein